MNSARLEGRIRFASGTPIAECGLRIADWRSRILGSLFFDFILSPSVLNLQSEIGNPKSKIENPKSDGTLTSCAFLHSAIRNRTVRDSAIQNPKSAI
jgi:hypothetical protein